MDRIFNFYGGNISMHFLRSLASWFYFNTFDNSSSTLNISLFLHLWKVKECLCKLKRSSMLQETKR